MSQESEKEREILQVMRKVLASIVKDTTPAHRGMKHPLSDGTIEDVRQCLRLISARERELADAAGAAVEKPYFSDEKPPAEVVSIGSLRKKKDDAADD
ncbi:MAG: segregation and condensation protein A [Pseudomonadota bacterium]